MSELIIILVIIFVVVVVLAIVSEVYLIKQDKKRNRNLKALLLSYDKPKQNRISMLKNDLINNNKLMSEREALELAIELERRGWRKEVKIFDVEVYL